MMSVIDGQTTTPRAASPPRAGFSPEERSGGRRFSVAPPPETEPGTDRQTLVLVAKRALNQRGDFVQIGRYLRRIAPDVEVVVAADRRFHALRPSLWLRPALVFSPTRVRRLRPVRGRVFDGRQLRKSEECRALEAHGIPVPRWTLLTEANQPDLSRFGEYVVSKPDRGGRGAEVKIRVKRRLRWKLPENQWARQCSDLFVQEFIYTGRWPVSYRVTTLFGKVLFCWRNEADRGRRPLPGPEVFGNQSGGGMSIVSSGRGCTYRLENDPAIIALGERAHGAFPNVPLLGVDVIREQPSGKLYVIEVNSCGHTWHFSSPVGRSIQAQFGLDLENQFDGLRKTAHLLLDQTRRHAC
ncbi:MAG: ATP-grasp domain-containing protein [Planctomycetes bacterium]|nr:ATP-grasp domain-containing protein [Planctomycetota bacterium]